MNDCILKSERNRSNKASCYSYLCDAYVLVTTWRQSVNLMAELDLGKLHWRKLSGARGGDGNNLVTPCGSLVVPSPGKLCPGILKGGEREGVNGSRAEYLETFVRSKAQVHGGKSWYQLERDAHNRRLWRETVDGPCS